MFWEASFFHFYCREICGVYSVSVECDLRVELNEEIYRKYSKYERINGTILL